MKQAPVGGNLVIRLSFYITAGQPTAVATFTIGPGELSASETTPVPVPSGAFWEVDITSVPTGAGTFPGSDLTILVQA